MSVSRAAVCKAIGKLREEGHTIDAIPHNGYRLKTDDSVLSAAYLSKYCDQSYRITVEKSVSSTNDILKQWAANGAQAGTVLVAGAQTVGKGRMSRRFYSPEGTGIYLSVLLRPKLSVPSSLRLTTASAVAVSRAIRRFTDEPVGIKWVNDLYMRNRKVCGILTEAAMDMESGMLDYAVVGIGLNLSVPKEGYPPEIADVAGAVFEDNVPDNIQNRMTAAILRELKSVIDDPSDSSVAEEYRSASWLNGKLVDVILADTSYPATVVGISENLELIVQTEQGEQKYLSSGEVSVKVR